MGQEDNDADLEDDADYGDARDESHDLDSNFSLSHTLKLGVKGIIDLKALLDKELSKNFASTPCTSQKPTTFTYNGGEHDSLKISTTSKKLQDIPVIIENTASGTLLVKVGPCDLSYVGGHEARAIIIQNLVTQALQKNGEEGVSFNDVNVSACIGVRGRWQQVTNSFPYFYENREQAGTHMNAYVKTTGEKALTHWEPRSGPQHWYDDSICAMVVATITSLFEHKVRMNSVNSSTAETHDILENPELVSIFDYIRSAASNRINHLLENLQSLLSPQSSTNQPKK